MAEQVSVASGPAAIIPQATGVASEQSEAKQTGGTAPGTTQPAGTAFAAPEEFASKGWKNQGDVYTSYKDLESQLGKISGERAEALRLLNYLEPYADEINRLIEEKSAGGNAAGGKTEPLDEVTKKLSQTVEQRFAAYDERQVNSAISNGYSAFQREYPDAKKYEQRMVALINERAVNITDRFNPDAHKAALVAAYRIAKQEMADKEEAGRKASNVEGGRSQMPAGIDPAKIPLGELKDMLQSGQG